VAYITKLKAEDRRKVQENIKIVESRIPSTSTVNVAKYNQHVSYMPLNMGRLFDFYGSNTTKGTWLNYLGKQKAVDAAVNILINGSKKYNKKRRNKKKTRKNRKRRKINRMNNRRFSPPRDTTVRQAANTITQYRR
jgi:hypothetical protein